MQTSLYVLITISVLAGFFMRPLNMLIFGKVVTLVKHVNSKSLVLMIMIGSMLTTQAVTIGAIYLSLKFSGFIPLAENVTTFVISFFVGMMIWVTYARLTSHQCPSS